MDTKYYLLIVSPPKRAKKFGPFEDVVERDEFLTRWIMLNQTDAGLALDIVNGLPQTDGSFVEYEEGYPSECLIGAPVRLIDTSEQASKGPHEITATHQGGRYDIEVTNLQTNEPHLTLWGNVQLIHADYTAFKARMVEQRKESAVAIEEGLDGIGITQEAHADNKGLKCPWCGDVSIVTGLIEAQELDATITAEKACTQCGKEWTDVYELTGYSSNSEK